MDFTAHYLERFQKLINQELQLKNDQKFHTDHYIKYVIDTTTAKIVYEFHERFGRENDQLLTTLKSLMNTISRSYTLQNLLDQKMEASQNGNKDKKDEMEKKLRAELMEKYHSEMKALTESGPVEGNKLETGHLECLQKLMGEFQEALEDSEMMLDSKVSLFEGELHNLYKSYKTTNTEKFQKEHERIQSVVNSYKEIYESRVTELFNKYPTGLDMICLERRHEQIQFHILSFVKNALKNTLIPVSIKEYKRDFEAFMNKHWIDVVIPKNEELKLQGFLKAAAKRYAVAMNEGLLSNGFLPEQELLTRHRNVLPNLLIVLEKVLLSERFRIYKPKFDQICMEEFEKIKKTHLDRRDKACREAKNLVNSYVTKYMEIMESKGRKPVDFKRLHEITSGELYEQFKSQIVSGNYNKAFVEDYTAFLREEVETAWRGLEEKQASNINPQAQGILNKLRKNNPRRLRARGRYGSIVKGDQVAALNHCARQECAAGLECAEDPIRFSPALFAELKKEYDLIFMSE